jgi:cytochrome b subunit of formate dehydrogenase
MVFVSEELRLRLAALRLRLTADLRKARRLRWPGRVGIFSARHLHYNCGKFGKYPLENKLYHLAILATGLAAITTGVFMMFRVQTIIFPRNPYLFSDVTWGMMYVLHGLAGVSLIALVMMHVYFAVRREKLPITKSMLTGSMGRDFYLQEHDPDRWVIESSISSPTSQGVDPEVQGHAR